MKLGNLTRTDKVWVPLVIASVAVGVHYGLFSEEQGSFLTENAPFFGIMLVQGAAVFLKTNRS